MNGPFISKRPYYDPHPGPPSTHIITGSAGDISFNLVPFLDTN